MTQSSNAVNFENKKFSSPYKTYYYYYKLRILAHFIRFHSIFFFSNFSSFLSSILSFYPFISPFFSETFLFVSFRFVSVPFDSVWFGLLLCFCCMPGWWLVSPPFIESISLMWKMLKMPSIHASTNVKCSIEPKLF